MRRKKPAIKPTGPPGRVLQEARDTIQALRGYTGEPATILEIGCNDGMHTRLFLEEYTNLAIYCFEPDPRPVPRFHAAVNDSRCRGLHQIAIAAETARVPFYLSGGTTPTSWLPDWDLSSSIRRPTGHLAKSDWVTFDRQIEVAAMKLDDWMQEHPEIDKIDLIWADVQGAEVDMIAGGHITLCDRTRYVFTEFYDMPLYEGQINLQQIKDMLPGFEQIGIYGENVLLRNTRL